VNDSDYLQAVDVWLVVSLSGVPLSNQWGQQGYFYPVQIAQYGLSHYSKYVKKSAKSSRQFVIEDAEDGTSSRWSVTGDATVHNVFDAEAQSRVIQFHTSGEMLFIFFYSPAVNNLGTLFSFISVLSGMVNVSWSDGRSGTCVVIIVRNQITQPVVEQASHGL